MTERDDDLELQALQRELDDAFATTRPRRGYEDELWLLIEQQRPATSRLGDALARFWRSARQAPAMPAAAVAAVLVVAISVGIVANGGFGQSRFSSTAPALSEDTSGRNFSGESPQTAANGFGRLPWPGDAKAAGEIPHRQVSTSSPEYYGPAQLVWSGSVAMSTRTAPVFRYQEPNSVAADGFAASLGARLVDRTAGNLGYYATSSYTLAVRGTVQQPPSSPAYFIASVSIPPVSAAGASAKEIATLFLAEHSLLPQWRYTVSVDSSGDPVKVWFERLFDVPGYGDAHLVDSTLARSGLEADVTGQRPVLVMGPLPVSLDSASYPIVSPAEAVNAAPSTPSAPTIQMTQAELVYVLVPAGDHSFYEPAYILTGTVELGGTGMVKHVLVPAVDPSQRSK